MVITSALQSDQTALVHTTVGAGLALSNSRVSRIWRIRHHSAITCEIPPRSVRTYIAASYRAMLVKREK